MIVERIYSGFLWTLPPLALLAAAINRGSTCPMGWTGTGTPALPIVGCGPTHVLWGGGWWPAR